MHAESHGLGKIKFLPRTKKKSGNWWGVGDHISLKLNSLVIQNPNECPIRTTVNKCPNEGELQKSVFELLGFFADPF